MSLSEMCPVAKTTIPLTVKTSLLQTVMNKASIPVQVKFLDFFQTSHHIYIVTEYCDGGTLLAYINACYAAVPTGVTHANAQSIFRQICLGLRYW